MWPRRNKIAGRSSYGRPSKGHRGRRSGAGYGRNRAEAADADPGREGKRQAGRRGRRRKSKSSTTRRNVMARWSKRDRMRVRVRSPHPLVIPRR